MSSQIIPPIEPGVRLVGGKGDWEGRVEVWYEGRWGTVCDDKWNFKETNVICRMLGYEGVSTGEMQARLYKFGKGVGDIILDELNCDGTEESIFDCPHNGYNITDCDHEEDIGVRCLRK